MFERILIANRGEIACRVIHTARRLGIHTTAVYSEADAGALHVRLADAARAIGGAAPRDSYLRIDGIIAAARQSGAQAIHPGYGFLAENPAFAEACAAADIVFIGPPAAAMRTMGSKSAARTAMQACGVPIVPGYHGAAQDTATLQAEAGRIGYPVLLKPSAGGGGKGMHLVARAADFAAALAACRREAQSSFGDAHVLLESYLVPARHVEVQICADRHGGCVHLFDRDCSLQRRHQKVVEEAPAPGLAAELRAALGTAAVSAARAVAYQGAGTVEFLLDAQRRFYFMEMNTRLQVEHPVTEMVTGQDLVEWQLRVAAGEALPRTQEQLALRGHAFETRVYAEDPDNGFLPSTGRLVHLAPPASGPHVRVDSGVAPGDAITSWYDPMIAKLVVHDETRELARRRLVQALRDFQVVGVRTNLAFLLRLVATPGFVACQPDTTLIEREPGLLGGAPEPVPRDAHLAATLATLLRERETADPGSPWSVTDGWRLNGFLERSIGAVSVGYRADHYLLTMAGSTTRARAWREPGAALLHMELDGTRSQATVVVDRDQQHVFLDGRHHVIAPPDAGRDAGTPAREAGGLVALLPGRVVAWAVEPGKRVAAGAPLLVLEAMKMEHTVVAPRDGRLVRFHFGVGEQVAEGAQLVEFE